MSCLFDSLFSLLNQYGIKFANSHELRLKVTTFMAENPHYSLGKDQSESIENWVKYTAKDQRKTSQQYLNAMRQRSTWGGGLEIAVMSKLFNCIIVVIRNNKVVSTFDNTDGDAEVKFTINWTGSHYTPLKLEEIQ